MAAMSISQLARSAGVGVETVRYYQRRGLLSDPRPQTTGVSGIRHYGPDELRRLRFVRSAQAAGFTLEEIAELLHLDSTGDRPRAGEMAREHRRSHPEIGLADYLVAATAETLGARLATLDARRFPMLSGLDEPVVVGLV